MKTELPLTYEKKNVQKHVHLYKLQHQGARGLWVTKTKVSHPRLKQINTTIYDISEKPAEGFKIF